MREEGGFREGKRKSPVREEGGFREGKRGSGEGIGGLREGIHVIYFQYFPCLSLKEAASDTAELPFSSDSLSRHEIQATDNMGVIHRNHTLKKSENPAGFSPTLPRPHSIDKGEMGGNKLFCHDISTKRQSSSPSVAPILPTCRTGRRNCSSSVAVPFPICRTPLPCLSPPCSLPVV